MKKLKSICVAAATVIMTFTGVFSITCDASATDSYFSNIYVQPNSGSWTFLPTESNGYRKKEYTTPVYLYLSSAQFSMNVQTWDCTQWSRHANRTGSSSTFPTTVYCSQGYEYIINFMRESYYLYATVGFISSNTYAGCQISGKWSPDWVSEAGHTYYALG